MEPLGEISKEDFEKLKTDKDFAKWFHENGYTKSSDMRQIIIEDELQQGNQNSIWRMK